MISHLPCPHPFQELHVSRRIAAAALVLVGLAACGGAGEGEPLGDAAFVDAAAGGAVDADAAADLAASVNDWGLRLHAEVVGDEPNVVTSPLSTATLLALAAAGSEGTTADEFVAALDIAGARDARFARLLRDLGSAPDAEVTIANAVWADDDVAFSDDYLAYVGDVFGATADTVDLGAAEGAEAVDTWVDERTRGLVGPVSADLGLPDPNTVAVLANAVHFLGEWTVAFDPDDTRDEPFTRADGSTVQVPMMRFADGEVPDEVTVTAEDDGTVFARLPYGPDGGLAMELLLPAQGEAPAEALTRLGDEGLRGLADRADTPSSGEVALPRLEVEWRAEVSPALQALGLESMYDGGFGPMFVDADPVVDAVVHATFLRVDEAGTEAAAVTAMSMDISAGPSYRFDRPFALTIRDEATGTLLFVGTIGDPAA